MTIVARRLVQVAWVIAILALTSSVAVWYQHAKTERDSSSGIRVVSSIEDLRTLTKMNVLVPNKLPPDCMLSRLAVLQPESLTLTASLLFDFNTSASTAGEPPMDSSDDADEHQGKYLDGSMCAALSQWRSVSMHTTDAPKDRVLSVRVDGTTEAVVVEGVWLVDEAGKETWQAGINRSLYVLRQGTMYSLTCPWNVSREEMIEAMESMWA